MPSLFRYFYSIYLSIYIFFLSIHPSIDKQLALIKQSTPDLLNHGTQVRIFTLPAYPTVLLSERRYCFGYTTPPFALVLTDLIEWLYIYCTGEDRKSCM